MKEHNKRWLISMMKTSGSKRRYVVNGSFSDERNTKKYQDIENLPNHESIGSTWKLYNGKLNYGLLVRFLRGQVGNDWDEVYSEIISRIPTKLLGYKEIVFWFVADKIELLDEKPYNKKTNKFIWTPDQGDYNFSFDNSDFYVCPTTNKLLKVEDKPSRKKTKKLENDELKKYRENEKNNKRNGEKRIKEIENELEIIARELLTENNKQKKGSR
ncbi:hypothetical protein [Empedobacter brevis]|uniref:hypothetical protein n=1 Tax=Empedobacter brevis TaxID=247 RepID=UPI0013202A07|nr:hypothetical protein [Empedobacter brevis]QHC86397.1 hypothetical protein AS589_17225 [Empedobacter brevis]